MLNLKKTLNFITKDIYSILRISHILWGDFMSAWTGCPT